MILGSDGAGVILEVATGAHGVTVGDEVVINPSLFWGPDETSPGPDWETLGVPRQGTYAERIAVPAEYVRPKPPRLSWQEAAALPLAGLTAWRAVATRARVEPGERVLVPGAGSAVAGIVIQLARDLGAEVIVTSSSPEKIRRSLAIGAKDGVLYTDPDWPRQVGRIDVVIDSVGEPTWMAANEFLRPGGRFVSYGRTAGSTVQFDIGRFFHAQWTFFGTANGSPREFDAMLDHVDRYNLRPVIDSVYPLERTADAHSRLESPDRFGKVIIDIVS
jgi:NADPH:quinone reductase-like Zn-dependent oxidoreductase